MPARPTFVSVVAPLTPAWERVKEVLFNPFDPAKWFVVGFCAWLAYLGQGGGGGGGNWNAGNMNGDQARHGFEEAKSFAAENLYWLAPVILFAILLVLAIIVLVTWVSSRGQFMFLHCVATNRAEIKEPWYRYSLLAQSLFVFRLILGVATAVIFATIAGTFGIALFALFGGDGPRGATFGIIALMVLVVVSFFLILMLIGSLTKQFVVPIMYARSTTCMSAWRELIDLASGNAARFVGYVLFNMLLHLGVGLITIALVLATCCIAGCILAIPYLGTVLYLPVYVFLRSYSAYYLAQYGPEFDVFQPEPPSGSPEMTA